jgi:putative N-acetylmannosamine-6-phosphate epimerase
MAAMALAAVQGGATAIRANGPADIRAIREAVRVPIIGLHKIFSEEFEVYITPTTTAAAEIAAAGADVIAIDATERPRPSNLGPTEHLAAVARATGRPVLADVSTFAEGVAAAAAGAAYVATTLSGYTSYSTPGPEPDLELVHRLAGHLEVPVIAEGRYSSPEQVAAAFAAGATAVVVGTAITNPRAITERFARAAPGGAG